MTKRLCCYILDQENLNSQCQNKAQYQIWSGEPQVDNYTEACAEHVEPLFDDSQSFSILRIYDQK